MNKNTTTYKVKVVNLTPAMAETLLAHNTHNRKVTQNRVIKWAESMKRGEWVMNAEPIKIAVDGTILDGQHRLLAVVQSGVTIPAMIVTGLPMSTQETMDTGKSRTLSDVLSLRGEKNAASLAAIIASIVRWEKYSPIIAFRGGVSSYPVTNGEAFEFLDRHPTVREVPTITLQAAKNAHITGKVLGTLYWKFSRIDRESADVFVYKLSTGEDLSSGDPILTLRNTIRVLHGNRRVGQISSVYLAAITIKAWNRWTYGEEARTLRYTPGGVVNEKFPAIAIPADKIIEMETEVSR